MSNNRNNDFLIYLDKSILRELLEKPEHLYELRRAISLKNKEIFEKEIKEKIKSKLNDEEDGLLNPDRLAAIMGSKVYFEIAGYHYISFSQGSWFRFIGMHYKDSELSKMEEDYYKEVRERVPKESNLFTSDALVKPIQIQFGGQQRNTTPYLSKRGWKELNETLRKVNLLKYVAKLPVDEEFEKKDSEEINKLLRKRSLKSFLDEFYDCLKSSYSKEKLDRIKTKNQKDKYRWLLELFVFSFFSTIHAIVRNKNKPLYVIEIPYKMEYEYQKNSAPEIVKYASFGGSYHSDNNKPLTEDQIYKLCRYLQLLPLYILAQEYSVSWDIIQPSTLIVEDVIRQCTSIDISETFPEVQKRLNRWQKQLNVWLKEYNYGQKGSSNSHTEKRELRDIDKISGYSNKYLSLLEDIKQVVNEVEVDEISGKIILTPTFIFLYSESGCGKEKIAKITHLLSYRAGKENVLKNTYIEHKKTNKPLYQSFKTFSMNANSLTFNNIKSKDLFFNYFPYNCSDLSEENCEKILFGCLEKGNEFCGFLLKAHLLCGTVFLDEFHNMQIKIVNKFLRIFAEPYSIYLAGYHNQIKLNIMVIFSSNKDKNELIKEGFNPALIDRITQNYFIVPPLRKRPEDIAIFVNYLIWYHNKKISNKIQYLDLAGLRLICELPWLDNYRGLQGLVNNIISNRRKRGLKSKRISFEEVVDALKNRGLIGEEKIAYNKKYKETIILKEGA